MAITKYTAIPPTQGTVNGATKIATNSTDAPAYVVVTNNHASNNLYLGGSDITTSNYGLSVATNNGTQAFYLAGRDSLYALTTGRALPATTSVASTDIFTSTGHAMAVGDMVVFTALTGGAGLQTNTIYYVISSNYAANTFMLSETLGGSTFNHTTNITACTAYTGTMVRAFLSGAF